MSFNKTLQDVITNDRDLPWLVLIVHYVPLVLRVKLADVGGIVDRPKNSVLVDSWINVMNMVIIIFN